MIFIFQDDGGVCDAEIRITQMKSAFGLTLRAGA